MLSLELIKNCCTSYYEQIPQDTLFAIGQSAIYSFSITLLLQPSSSLVRPLYSAGLAALATLIYSVTNPIFNHIFQDNKYVSHREVTKYMITMVLTQVLVNTFTPFKVAFLKGADSNLPKFFLLSNTVIKVWLDVYTKMMSLYFGLEFRERVSDMFGVNIKDTNSPVVYLVL